MTKLSKDELLLKIGEKVENDDVAISLMEDITDSFDTSKELADYAKLKTDYDKLKADNDKTVSELSELKQSYKERFMTGSAPKDEPKFEELEEKQYIDIKEI